jgi:hypothetical protein
LENGCSVVDTVDITRDSVREGLPFRALNNIRLNSVVLVNNILWTVYKDDNEVFFKGYQWDTRSPVHSFCDDIGACSVYTHALGQRLLVIAQNKRKKTATWRLVLTSADEKRMNQSIIDSAPFLDFPHVVHAETRNSFTTVALSSLDTAKVHTVELI